MKACIFDGRDTNEEVDGREMDGMKMKGRLVGPSEATQR